MLPGQHRGVDLTTHPAPSPLGHPSHAETATAQAELQIVLLPLKEAKLKSKDMARGPGSRSGPLIRTAGRLGHLLFAATVIGTYIRRRASRSA